MAICPQCHTLHGDRHQFCQRCGNPLAPEENAPQNSCSNCQEPVFPGQNFCTECGQRVRVPVPTRSSRKSSGKGVFYPPPPERGTGPAPRRRSRAWIGILTTAVVVIGLTYVWLREPTRKPTTPPIEKAPSYTPVPRTDSLQREVERVAEKIRAAHMNKDMNQFLGCYSSSYPDLGQLERATYANWKMYDFKNVSYNISNVHLIGPNLASAEVIWNFQLFNNQTKAYELHRAAFQVILEGSGGAWKIRESKEIGYS